MEPHHRERGPGRGDRGVQREAGPRLEEPLTYRIDYPELPRKVWIREVGPRDGIQSEKALISTEDKIRFIDALSASGLRYIEAVSFVSPKAVPQMADARKVWNGIDRRPGVFYSALVPNRRGAEIAAEVGVDGLQVFISSTDAYNRTNVGKTVDASFSDLEDVVKVAREAGIPVEGTISTVFGYGGEKPRVVEISQRMVDLGITTISYGDTTGMGTPLDVWFLLESLNEAVPEVTVNLHLHDTRGTGLANVLAGLCFGVDYFDASVGGMGGSPFASGATGNVVTEDLVHMLTFMQIETGVSLDALLDAARLAQDFVEGELPSKLLKAGPREHVVGP